MVINSLLCRTYNRKVRMNERVEDKRNWIDESPPKDLFKLNIDIGGININYLKKNKSDIICRYASMLINCNCLRLIDLPTRARASSSIL